jgi:two-component system chemotaxis sensor kinase CheA
VSLPQAEFIEIFRDEARGRLDRIVETLLAVEAGRPPADAVDLLFRELHTIKGAAGMVGLEEIQALAHAMEDVLERTRAEGEFPSRLVDVLLRAADALRRHVDGTGEPVEALVAEIAASLAGAEPSRGETRAAPTAVIERPGRRSIRVAPEKIDALLDLVGETVLHRRRLEHAIGKDTLRAEQSVSDELDAGGHLLDGLKDAAIGMRTLPLSSIVGSLPRAVRDLGVETGKEVSLAIEGAETELDRTILESLSDLLVHLIRNAVAHGIEPADERERRGKPACGQLKLSAEQRGGIVEVVLSDDGRGVSPAALEEARHTGSLAAVLARPGYSTAGGVSDIAGRGVGLDAVKSQVEAFGGTLELQSEPGVGTDVILRLPLALALLEVLLVERAGNVYGLPLASVEEAISLERILSLGGRPSVELRGDPVAVADLAELVGGMPAPASAHPPAIVVRASGRRVAAICDSLLGNDEVVVKALGPLLDSLSMYLGAAILGDGRIALLVDPAKLVQSAARRGGAVAQTGKPAEAAPEASKEVTSVLVVEDSLAVRELQRSILEAAGYRVETAHDGQEALDRLERDETIDLVLTDVDMPNLDGIALTKAIRAHPIHSALPVVVVTSRGEEDDRRRGMDAGADAYMVKRGFDQHLLLETVERLIGR